MFMVLPPISYPLPANFKINNGFPKLDTHLFAPELNAYRRNPMRIPSIYRFRFSTTSPVLAVNRDVDSFTKYSGYIFDSNDSDAEVSVEYDSAKLSAIYRRKPLLLLRRLLQVGTTFGRWFALRYIDTVMGRSDEMFKVRAAELRKVLVELGPAFVKIAQAISS